MLSDYQCEIGLRIIYHKQRPLKKMTSPRRRTLIVAFVTIEILFVSILRCSYVSPVSSTSDGLGGHLGGTTVPSISDE